jgi:hypothetical protein
MHPVPLPYHCELIFFSSYYLTAKLLGVVVSDFMYKVEYLTEKAEVLLALVYYAKSLT